jgi:hypothetical protein
MPGAIVTICSHTTRIGTSTPYGARKGFVHTPVATTTVPAEIWSPSARRTPVTRSPSSDNAVTVAPWRIRTPAARADAANACAVMYASP